MSALPAQEYEVFAGARLEYAAMEKFVSSREASQMTAAELEREIQQRGRELMRQLYQAHVELRGPGEAAGPVQGADGVERPKARMHERGLQTVFGEVRVERLGYGAKGAESLHPLDAELNLPVELYSHEVRRQAALETAKSSYDDVVELLGTVTSAGPAKRQTEEMAIRAAQDFDAFYQQQRSQDQPAEETGAILVITADGKGVPMRREDLRKATRKRAEQSTPKMESRRSRGEKPHKKRMATVAGVYTIAPYERAPEDVVRCMAPRNEKERPDRPLPENKRVWASLQKKPGEVIAEAFREAKKRDPQGGKQWVALVDGNEPQIKILTQCFHDKGRDAVIVLDFIHVAERVWKAGLDLYAESSKELEIWVTERLLEILRGRCSHVAAGMRRSATIRGLNQQARKRIDSCAGYLLNYKNYMHYDEYLDHGFPIATGVIEGACRYLVKDRMERTGARWRLKGAEAVLRLRALRKCGDFDSYWAFHEKQEYQRNHAACYGDGIVVPIKGRQRLRLIRIK